MPSRYSAAGWTGGSVELFEEHVSNLKELLGSDNDILKVLKHWEDQLMQTASRLQPAPLKLPNCGEWLYLFITDSQLSVLQHSQLLVLAHAGHALAQRIVVVDQVNHFSFFSGPVELQREVARMNKGCCAPLA